MEMQEEPDNLVVPNVDFLQVIYVNSYTSCWSDKTTPQNEVLLLDILKFIRNNRFMPGYEKVRLHLKKWYDNSLKGSVTTIIYFYIIPGN